MRNFIWYKNVAILEKRHPMMAGFFRRKRRRAMRHGVPVPTRWTFAKMRVGEIASYLEGMVQPTRPRSAAEEQLVHEMTRI